MSGFRYFLVGLKLLNQPRIRLFVVMPVLVNLVLFSLLSWLLIDQLGVAANWLDEHLAAWLDWLLWLLWVIVGILWLVIYGYSFAMISNIIAAPFYGLLAERVQAHLSGNIPDTGLTFNGFMVMVKRTLVRELQKLAYLLPRLLLLILVSVPLYFIPVIGVAVPVIWFLWSAWSLALENVDYAADNNQISFTHMRQSMKKSRITYLSFGSAAALAASIPLFNLLAIPAAVAGGTALWLDQGEL
ncbi:MAG: sulfate transporter CysZ [Porticoccaceae bacterium]|jgi:CysZ protein